jgi:predicted ferric reductase
VTVKIPIVNQELRFHFDLLFISGALGLELAEGNNTKYVLPVLFILVKKSKSLRYYLFRYRYRLLEVSFIMIQSQMKGVTPPEFCLEIHLICTSD